MKLMSTFIFLIFFSFQLCGQSSFVKTINYQFNPLFPVYNMEIGTNDEISYVDMLGFSGPDEHFKIVNISSDGKFASAFSIKIDSILTMSPDKFLDRVGDFSLVQFGSFSGDMPQSPGVFCFNNITQSFWCKKMSSIQLNGSIPSAIAYRNNLVLSFIFSNEHSGLGAFDIMSGKTIWAYQYSPQQNPQSGLGIEQITEYPDKDISLSFFTIDENGLGRNGLAILSPIGELINNIILREETEDLFFFTDQNLGIDDENNLVITGITKVSDTLSRESKPFIAKFDSNLDLVWAKRLFAENFPYEGLKHRVFPNGEVIFVYNTNGDLPVIVGKLDSDGNLLWHRGYSFFNPEIQIGSDGSIYFLSPQRYLPDGTAEPATLLAKADPNGDIDDCPQFDACLTLFDMDIPYERWDWIREPADTFGTYNATITPFITTTEDYCGTPAKPTAFFSLPDTICQNTILEPDSLNNRSAHATQWTITGTNTDISLSDTSWQYEFTEPGEYQIEQEVWLLGCSEFHAKTLIVLKDSLGDLLGDDRLICEGDSIIFTPKGARPLKTFDWSDGSTNSSITVSESGTYGINASDGFCSAQDEINLTFIEDRYPEPIINLPTDSMICIDLLPIIIQPTSIYTDSFYLENSNEPQPVFELNAAGNYRIEAHIENCRVEQNFELKITPCEIDIFIPNSFSPNDDGINDFAEPLGKDFSGLSLEVYNRWGGKVFETTTGPFAWDGKFDSKKANEGVYVLIFKYQNQRNGKEELISGDVLLVR